MNKLRMPYQSRHSARAGQPVKRPTIAAADYHQEYLM
jgi:hypothetical protein